MAVLILKMIQAIAGRFGGRVEAVRGALFGCAILAFFLIPSTNDPAYAAPALETKRKNKRKQEPNDSQELGGQVAQTACKTEDATGQMKSLEATPSSQATTLSKKSNSGSISQVVEVGRDIPEDTSLQDQILLRNRELSTINGVASILSQSLSLENTLRHALQEVKEAVEADAAAIYLVNQESGLLELTTYLGLSEQVAESMMRIMPGEPVGGGVVESGEPLIIADISKYRRAKKSHVQAEGLVSVAQVPLKAKGVVIGVLLVAGKEEWDFTEAEIGLLTSVCAQIAMAVENSRLYGDLQAKERIRGELLEKVITAEEDERKRVARELHDETSQSLVALMAAIEMAMAVSDDPVKVRSSLQRMQSLAQHTLAEVHKLIFDLRPTLLDDLGLIAAVRWYAESRLGEEDIELQFDAEGVEERRLPPNIETALFRVMQEAISNIAGHSNAGTASISLEIRDVAIIITIEDDGQGFIPSRISRSPVGKRGLGLLGMKERVEQLGGVLSIHSQPTKGTRLVIRVPLEGQGEYDE